MNYRVLDETEADIAVILTYVAERDPVAADRMYDAMLKAFETLGKNPMLGHRRPDLTRRNFRFWPVRHWLVVHRGRDPVEIVAVLDARRDLADLLD